MHVGVVIPIFNERRMLPTLMARVDDMPPPPGCARTIILVDDASTDGSASLVDEYAARNDVLVRRHERNAGKGAAVRTGLTAALDHGVDVAIIQDADLEYDPADHDRVLAPILDDRTDVVIGSRFTRHWPLTTQYVANRIITFASNMATGLDLTDVECCFKAFSRSVIARIDIEEDRFGLEPELVAKIARLSPRVVEVPVSFHPRSRREGKKIGWKDGVSALRCIVRYSPWWTRHDEDPSPSPLDRLRAAFESQS